MKTLQKVCLPMKAILVPKRALLYESLGQSSSSKLVESVGGVHSQRETSHCQLARAAAFQSIGVRAVDWHHRHHTNIVIGCVINITILVRCLRWWKYLQNLSYVISSRNKTTCKSFVTKGDIMQQPLWSFLIKMVK